MRDDERVSETRTITRVTWEASGVLGWGGFLESHEVGPAGPRTPFPDAGGAPVIARVPRAAGPRRLVSVMPEVAMVTSWTVATGALDPLAAYEALLEAEPLLAARVPELARDFGRRYFRLAGGQLLDPCVHPGAIPVDQPALLGGERVAWLCPECDAQLPADWSSLRPQLRPFMHVKPGCRCR